MCGFTSKTESVEFVVVVIVLFLIMKITTFHKSWQVEIKNTLRFFLFNIFTTHNTYIFSHSVSL